MTVESRKYLRDLRRLVDQHFSLEDIKLLCFDLETDYDHLAGDGKLLKIEALCKHLARRGRLQDVLVLLQEERPQVDWPTVPPPAQQVQDETELQQSGGDRIGALQRYLDVMTENLEALRKSKVREPIHIRAHADTQLILETLDPAQKALVVKFLYESGLLNHQNATYLERSNLSDAVLEGMNLCNTPLTETNLSGAHLKAANLTGAKLNKSRLSRADLTSADLTKAMLIRADLTEADLGGAQLRDAYLQEANLAGAKLEAADLTGADLTGASLADAVVTPEQLSQARSLRAAVMPDGAKFILGPATNDSQATSRLGLSERWLDSKRSGRGALLVVEDDNDISHMLRIYFQSQGYTVMIAGRGSEALGLCGKQLPDVILLDIMLPDMDGYEVFRRLRATPRTRDIPIIVLTQKDEPGDRLAALEVGAEDYITKPFLIDMLEARVRLFIQSKKPSLLSPFCDLPTGRYLRDRLKWMLKQGDWGIVVISIQGLEQLEEKCEVRVADNAVLTVAQALSDLHVDEDGDDFIGHLDLGSFVVVTSSEHSRELVEMCRTRWQHLFSDSALISTAKHLAGSLTVRVGALSSKENSFASFRELTLALDSMIDSIDGTTVQEAG
jgi:DNA-binding response OmpR family regulator/uncharacterized protein YjbI with pentapeptide repeats